MNPEHQFGGRVAADVHHFRTGVKQIEHHGGMRSSPVRPKIRQQQGIIIAGLSQFPLAPHLFSRLGVNRTA